MKEEEDKIKITCDVSFKTWLNIPEAIVYTTLGEKKLRSARIRNELTYYEDGGRIFYKRTDLDQWMSNHELHSKGKIRPQKK